MTLNEVYLTLSAGVTQSNILTLTSTGSIQLNGSELKFNSVILLTSLWHYKVIVLSEFLSRCWREKIVQLLSTEEVTVPHCCSIQCLPKETFRPHKNYLTKGMGDRDWRPFVYGGTFVKRIISIWQFDWALVTFLILHCFFLCALYIVGVASITAEFGK